MIQLAWRFQKDSALAQRFRARTEKARGKRKLMIVALARKLLIDVVVVEQQRALGLGRAQATRIGAAR
jgi:hypothetical protein